jgi:hypothetical protein
LKTKEVVRKKTREKSLLTVKMSPDVYARFAAAAMLRGSRPSSLVHQFAVGIIREEQMHDPITFAATLEEVKKRIAEHSAQKKKLSKARLVGQILEMIEPDKVA